MAVTEPWTEAAKDLADKVTANAPEWREAVSATPRHLLVPRWWERIPDNPAEEWELVAHTEDAKARITAAYTDETLVTRVGPLHADHAQPGEKATGSPTSSSTLPGLIVLMLHHLGIEPGHKVLDAGTGSGYSSALISRRIGDEHVTSVDVDPYLVQAARARLAAFGRTPRIEAIDATGALPDSEYDRILATVSVRPVPESWVRALRPGGRIVTTIARTGCLLSADMDGDGIARGHVLPDYASFMVTRQEADYAPRLDSLYLIARDSDGEHVRPTDGPLPDLWGDWEFQSLYELQVPGVERRAVNFPDGQRIAWLLAADGSWARAEDDGSASRVHQDGPRRLWDDLERVRRRWEDAGRFPLHRLSVEITPDGSTLTAPDGSWTFAV